MTGSDGFGGVADDLYDLADQFEQMAENARELDGKNEVAFAELFTEEFMRRHTDVTSFEAFLQESRWEVESEQEFEAIPEDEFDEYVGHSSEFESWEEMLGTAGTEWLASEIGFR